MKPLLLLSFLTLLLASCVDEQTENLSYFPLREGMQWDYSVTTTINGEIERNRFSIRMGDQAQIDGQYHSVRITSDGTRYYLAHNSAGIYRHAKRTLNQGSPTIEEEPHWILKYPLQEGTQWSNPTYPFVIRRIYPYEERLTRGMRVKMNYQISSTDDTVTVPAGRFNHCIRVRGEANLTLYADGRKGYEEILINTTEWYAPGVGLVKLLREEPLSNDVFAGGEVVYELNSVIGND